MYNHAGTHTQILEIQRTLSDLVCSHVNKQSSASTTAQSPRRGHLHPRKNDRSFKKFAERRLGPLGRARKRSNALLAKIC
jgi:hypothetical protein